MVNIVPFLTANPFKQLSQTASRMKSPLTGPYILEVSFQIQSIQTKFFKFSQLQSSSFIYFYIFYRSFCQTQGFWAMQQIIVITQWEVVSVPATKNVLNYYRIQAQLQNYWLDYLEVMLARTRAQIMSFGQPYIPFYSILFLAISILLLINFNPQVLKIVILRLTSLSLALIPISTNFTPKIMGKNQNPCDTTSLMSRLIKTQTGTPSNIQSVAPPKKHSSTTLENILTVRSMTSYQTMCPWEPDSWVAVAYTSVMAWLQSFQIFGVMDFMKSKLKTAFIILRFRFHYWPQLKGMPRPMALTIGAVENLSF